MELYFLDNSINIHTRRTITNDEGKKPQNLVKKKKKMKI